MHQRTFAGQSTLHHLDQLTGNVLANVVDVPAVIYQMNPNQDLFTCSPSCLRGHPNYTDASQYNAQQKPFHAVRNSKITGEHAKTKEH